MIFCEGGENYFKISCIKRRVKDFYDLYILINEHWKNWTKKYDKSYKEYLQMF